MLFWLVCATFVAIALAFVLPPLLQKVESQSNTDETTSKEANVEVYRDQLAELQTDLRNGLITDEQYQQDRQEYERRLLEDVSTADQVTPPKSNNRQLAYVLALALPVAAVVFYLRVGHPSSLSASPVPAGRSAAVAPEPSSTTDEAGFSPQRIEANVAALAKKLEQNPNDVSGWIMLGRSYTSLEKYSDASAAYEKAAALKSDDADLWADYAFTLAMASDKKLAGKPTELIKKALQIDPENPKALELAGSAAFEANDFKAAIKHWERLLEKTGNDPEIKKVLSERIAEARKRLQ